MEQDTGAGDGVEPAEPRRARRGNARANPPGAYLYAFETLSSASLFVAATFQAASQRPSAISLAFLVLFGAERVLAGAKTRFSDRPNAPGRPSDDPARVALWRWSTFLAMTAIAGECLAQIAFAAFGPEWPRTSKHRTALRWLGFQPLHGAHEMFAETAGGDGETLLPTSDASSGAPREGINERNETNETFFERRLAMPLAAFACVVAGVANPSVAARSVLFYLRRRRRRFRVR
jgi:hypothetical protein